MVAKLIASAMPAFAAKPVESREGSKGKGASVVHCEPCFAEGFKGNMVSNSGQGQGGGSGCFNGAV